jgi:hypothetical protein
MKRFILILLVAFIGLYAFAQDEIIFHSEGATFSPVVQLKSTATVLWTFQDGTTSSSLNPEKDYGSEASRPNRLKVTPWSAVRLISIGYDYGDGGSEVYPLVKDQHVSKVENLSLVKNNLEVWCSSFNKMDTLIFDDFVLLDTIECFISYKVKHVSLKNTPSLTRLCLEDNDLYSLDISESPKLTDLRAASSNYTTVKFSNSTEEFWHVCVRDNEMITDQTMFEDMSRFPNIGELFIWNTNQKGSLRMRSSRPQLWVQVLAYQNAYTRIDLRGSLQQEINYGEINFNYNNLVSVRIDECDQLQKIFLNHNALSTDSVDDILRQVDAFGTSNGILDLALNKEPSAAGLVHKANLESRGWTVVVQEGFYSATNPDGNLIDQFSILPNPARDYIQLTIPAYQGNSEISVFSASGTLIVNEQFSGDLLTLPISGLSPGMYAVRLKQGSQVVTKKILIR